MNLNEYQSRAMVYAKYKSPDYPFLALSEEAGEVNGKVAKGVRKAGISASDLISSFDVDEGSHIRDSIKKELGDVLWQLSACAKELGFSLEEIAIDNLDKLKDRGNRGVIVGEGDNR